MEYTVAAVQEALSVLTHVAQAPGLGVTELAKRSGNTKARTFRLLSTLEQSGFVQRDSSDTNYILGHVVLALGLAAQEQISLVRIGQKHLEMLGGQFNENVHIRIRDGLQSEIVAKWDCTRGVRVHTEIGTRRHLHAGASGKVLLAYAPDDLQRLVLGGPLDRFTPQTVVQKTKLAKELARIREEGYAVSMGEVIPDVVAVAAPIFDAQGHVLAALGVSIPASRAPADLTPIVNALKSTGMKLSTELGWREGVHLPRNGETSRSEARPGPRQAIT